MVRTGNPCSMGSGSPFMATASIALRSSIIAASGVPQVQPSSEVCRTASASGWGPASARIAASRTPLHQALPIRSPPTSLDTQLSVIQSSVISRETRSRNDSRSSRSTMPWMRSSQSAGAMVGLMNAVSIR
ncbi:hypothetical protein D9M69_545130 [compost metagenome]